MLIFCPLFLNQETLSFNTEKAEVWSDGWTLQTPGQGNKQLNLPIEMGLPANTKTVVSHALPDKIVPGRCLCIRASSQTVRVFVNGEEIANHGLDPETRFGKLPGSAWVLFRLPDGAEGGTLTIENQSPYKEFSGTINAVLYGSKASIMFSLLHSYGLAFLIAVIMFMGSVAMLINGIFSSAIKGPEKSNITCLAFFALFASMWIMGESKMLQFFTDNIMIVYYMNYLSLFLMPLPLTVYFSTAYKRHIKPYSTIFFYLFLVYFIVAVVLQFGGVADFFSLVPLFLIMVSCYMAMLVFSLAYETFKYHNRDARQYLICVLVPVVATMIEIVLFVQQNYNYTSSFMRWGLVVCILAFAFISLRRLHRSAEAGREAKVYHRLAYLDLVTNGRNRTAFQQDIEEKFVENCKPNTWLLIFDMNKMKDINDDFGHLVGDEAIRTSYNAIAEAFAPTGVCYRIGGDEFGCIISGCDYMNIEERLVKLEQWLVEANAQLPYNVELACGYACYDKKRWPNFSDFWSFVDKKMYDSKNGGRNSHRQK